MKFNAISKRVLVGLGTTVVLGLAGAPAASASSVNSFGNLVFYSGTTADNTVSLASVSGGGISITDSEPITVDPGSNCTGGGTNTVSCPGDATATPPVGAAIVGLGDGNDTFSSSALIAQTNVNGGAGNDTISGSPGQNDLFGDVGDDKLTGSILEDDLDGGADTDTLDGGPANDDVSGGDGNDAVSGGEGDDEASGGLGDDTVNGNAGGDELYGDTGTDTVNGDDGDDFVSGDRGGPLDPTDPADVAGNDTLNGGNGEDFFAAGTQSDPGADAINGGAGTDEVSYDDEEAGVNASADGVAGDGASGENDNIGADVEDIDGSEFADTLTGNAAANNMFGGAGVDTLNGLGGDDSLSGSSGNDTVNGGDGRDDLFGNDGSDAVNGNEGDDSFFEQDGEPDVLQGAGGADTINYLPFNGRAVNVSLDGQANDGLPNENDNAVVENVNTSNGNDVITGSGDRNVIDSGDGDDQVNTAGDAAQDDVSCGTGFDSATVDAATDAVATVGEATRCETVNGGAIKGQSAANVNPVVVFDKTAPKITVKITKCKAKGTKLKAFGKSGCVATLKGDEPFRTHAEAQASYSKVTLSKTIGKGLVLYERDTGFSAGTTNQQKITIKPNKKLIRKTAKKFKVRIVLESFDRGGNRKAITKTITVKK